MLVGRRTGAQQGGSAGASEGLSASSLLGASLVRSGEGLKNTQCVICVFKDGEGGKRREHVGGQRGWETGKKEGQVQGERCPGPEPAP